MSSLRGSSLPPTTTHHPLVQHRVLQRAAQRLRAVRAARPGAGSVWPHGEGGGAAAQLRHVRAQRLAAVPRALAEARGALACAVAAALRTVGAGAAAKSQRLLAELHGWAVLLGSSGPHPSRVTLVQQTHPSRLTQLRVCRQSRPAHASAVSASKTLHGPAPPRPSRSYNTLISSLAKAGRCAEAVHLHARMQREGIPDDVWTLTALITAAERAPPPAAAAPAGTAGVAAAAAGATAGEDGRGDWAEGARERHLSSSSSSSEAVVGGWQAALGWFRDFQRRGVAPNTVAYNRLIGALGSGGQWQLALAAFEAMRASSSRASSGSGSGSSSSSGPSSSRSSSGSTAPCVRPDIITYGSLISALERAGQWQRALQLHEEVGGHRVAGPCCGIAPVAVLRWSMVGLLAGRGSERSTG